VVTAFKWHQTPAIKYRLRLTHQHNCHLKIAILLTGQLPGLTVNKKTALNKWRTFYAEQTSANQHNERRNLTFDEKISELATTLNISRKPVEQSPLIALDREFRQHFRMESNGTNSTNEQ